MEGRRRRTSGVLIRRGLGVSLVTALVFLMVLGPAQLGFVSLATAGTPSVSVSRPGAWSVSATVTWNGANINTASGASSAIGFNFGNTANVLFSWTIQVTPGGSTSSPSITDARLQMIYLGAALATRDVSPIGPPSSLSNTAVMNWSTGELTYVLEGVYKVTASLLSNGTTEWSESFYLRATAPYSLLAAFPIILIVIGIWELYAVARSGRYAVLAKRGAPPPSAPPTTPPTTPPPTPPSWPPATPPPTETPETTGPPPSPPSEGSA